MANEEESKQTPRKVPPDLTQFEQANADFAMAMALQEQERPFPTMLSTIESENEEDIEDADEENSDADDNDYEYFESHEFEDDRFDQFLEEEEDSNYPEDEEYMEEDDIDPDELSYEELIALGEFIGVEKRGLSSNEIPSCLRDYKFVSAESKTGIDRCVICQMEYEEEESLVVLACEHPYHSECISKWLQMNKACPICSIEASCPKTKDS